MTNRKLSALGLHPIPGFCLLFLGFTGLSLYLFSKTEYASYIFILIALYFTAKLSETKRNDFLKYCFRDAQYRKLRLIENLIVVFPFIAFLIYEQLFLSVLLLSVLTMAMALVNFTGLPGYPIPTPFSKNPFEFTVGFRNTFYLFVLTYFLSFIAISVDNFNLGIFTLLLVFLVSLSFYSKPENEYYVWVFNETPKGFLNKKIKTGLIHSSILVMPVFFILVIFFSSQTYTLLIFLLLAYVYLITIILAKYSAYPNEINLPQGVLIGLSLLFPPILIGIIPFFYLQSVKRLNDILV